MPIPDAEFEELVKRLKGELGVNSGDDSNPAPGSGQTPRNPNPAPTGQQRRPAQGDGSDDDGEEDEEAEQLNKRLSRAQRQGQRALLVNLGYNVEDIRTKADLETAIADLTDRLTGSDETPPPAQTPAGQGDTPPDKTTPDKPDPRLAQLESALEAEKRARRADQQKIVDLAVDTAILQEVGTQAQSPDDVIAWARRERPDLVEDAINDEGQVDKKVIKQIVTECKKERKHYFATGRQLGSPSNAGARVPVSPGGADLDSRIMATLANIRRNT